MAVRIILASGSPRRRALLHDLGLTFEVYKPDVDESHSPDENPESLCARLSRLKAESGAQKFPDAVVIAADTIVVIDGHILGKPASREDALRMLKALRGREHEVLTGLSVCMNRRVLTHVEHTTVKFRPLTDAEISAYVSTGECDDKAGAYAVQGKGSLLIEGLQGDYFNVVGLPVCRLGIILHEFGINILAGTE
ncbi:MAG: septum formation inhibitor Maf [Synergistaceae bacterium]|nr:septum formation inhibitor Maf [Synergistaceae bacterium]